MQEVNTKSLADAALYYAKKGYHVFPLQPGSKVPLEKGGVNAASADPDVVGKWWLRTPNANVGIALAASGLGVIDLDVKPAKGIDGRKTFRSITLLSGQPDSRCVQSTPSGGLHHVFETRNGLVDKVAWREGIDILTAGHRYIVASPSHIDGKKYKWTSSDSPSAIGPVWSDLLTEPTPERKRRGGDRFGLGLDDDKDDEAGDMLDRAAIRMVGVTLKEVDSILRLLDPSAPRDTWLRILWGAAAQWAGTEQEEEIIDKLEEWSSTTEVPGQYKRGEVAKRWKEHTAKGGGTTGAGHVTWRTVRSMAEKLGWSPLSLSGIDKDNWKTHLHMATDANGVSSVKPDAWNGSLALAYHPKLMRTVRRNVLTGAVELSGTRVAPLRDPTRFPVTFDKEADWPGVSAALRGVVAGNLSKDNVIAAVKAAATIHAYDPLKEWVEGLKWDGESRLDGWLSHVTKCADSPLNRAIGRAWMVGLAYRATTEWDGNGTKMDSVLVLQGKEGVGKSTVGNILGGDWYASFGDSLDNDGIYYVIERTMVLEFDELDSMNKTDASRVKSLVTTQCDIYRRKYGETASKKPRRCVFIGTTNDAQFISREMTVRRWWVVPCGKGEFDLPWLRANREQLIAEAVVLKERGELPLLPRSLRDAHRDAVMDAQLDSQFDDAVMTFSKQVDKGDKFTLSQIAERAIARASSSMTMTEQRNFGNCLRAHNWTRTKIHGLNYWTLNETE